MPSTKRAGDEADSSQNAHKYARTEGNDEYAGSSRRKASGSTRTGQACDRCKVRKIRCDARIGGCSPCVQNNTECKTTDRITGRATSRGHTENLEHENTNLKMYIIELQAQLRQNQIEPGPAPSVPQEYTPPSETPVYGQSWETQQSNGYGSAQQERSGSAGSLLPEYRPGCIGDNYLGVESQNNWLSPIEGTSLALFGTKIELTEFMPPEPNEAASAMSYQTFLGHAFGKSPTPPRPDLPSYNDSKVFAEWYFRSVQVFVPILHKPDFMQLLTRIYHEGYHPSPAETVMVHMVLAVMNFQWAARNGSEQSRTTSFEHHHYALSFIPQLITGHTLADMQALTIICFLLRAQPRPGPAWMFTNLVLGLAIELGLHRSAKAWPSSAEAQDVHTVELRKRIFWSLLVLHVGLSGKLGRPMPLRFEDFDIEIPEAVNDNLPSEVNLPKWRKCSFRAGIQGMKVVKILIQVYRTIYSVRASGSPYDVHVRQIEKDLQAFQQQVPPELSGGPQTREEDRVSALYLLQGQTEAQLLLHHPSLCRSNSTEVANRNLEICLEVCNTFLATATQIKRLKSLDTTWYSATNYLAAIFTTLFAYTEKRDKITSADLQRLRQDMDAWLDVMGDVGKLIGTGVKLQAAIRNIIDFSISNIHRHLASKTASAAMASAVSPNGPGPQEQHQQPMQQQHHQPTYQQNSDYYSDPNATNNQAQNYQVDTHNGQSQQPQSTYPAPTHFAYPEPQTASMPQYSATSMAAYDTSAYGEDLKPTVEAQLTSELAPMRQQQHHRPQQPQMQQVPQQQYMPAFHSPVQQHQNGFHAAMPQAFPHAGSAAWRNFADNIMPNMGGQEHYANALMSLGKPDGTVGSAQDVQGEVMTAFAAPGQAAAFGGMQMPVDGTQTWPLISYSNTGAVDGQG